MAKNFIVGVTKIVYHPKDEFGKKMMNVNKNAVNLHLIKKSLQGFEVETMFVGEDMVLYQALFDRFGSSCDQIANWSVNIERNSQGFVDEFEPIKHFETLLSGIAETFGLDKPVQK